MKQLMAAFVILIGLLWPGSAGAEMVPAIVSVAGGGNHSIAVLEDGSVWNWGWNISGQLGNGTTLDQISPVQAGGLSDVVAVSAGFDHNLALKSDGTVWAWGGNGGGKLGDGTETDRKTPVQVSGLTGVVAVSAGANHSLALKEDGTVWGWGWNDVGQLGNGTSGFENVRLLPVPVLGLSGVMAISAGYEHSLAVKSDGTVWAWGSNANGQLGDDSGIQRNYPVQAHGLSEVLAVAAGGFHSLALKSDGSVWSWGSNLVSQLGDGTNVQKYTPVRVTGVSDVKAIAAGNNHNLVLTKSGAVWTWGHNLYNQLADGTTANRNIPYWVSQMEAVAVAAGGGHSLVLRSDGSIWSWGYNWYGQLGDGTDNNQKSTPGQVQNLGRVLLPGPAAAALQADQTGLACGQLVTFTAASRGFLKPVYDFWLQEPTEGSWSHLQSYSTSNQASFTQEVPGNYSVVVFAKGQADPNSRAVASEPVAVTFTGPGVSGLVVTGPNGAQPVGSDALFTAAAIDEGGTPLYQFWLHDSSGWRVVQNYSPTNTYALNNLQPGSYVIAVYALDQLDIAAGNWTAAYYQVFILNVGSILQLTAPASVGVGGQVDLQASAYGIIGAEYQYWYQSPDGGWHQSGSYSSSGNYSFTATDAGTYRVVAYAKDHYAPATDQFAVTAVKEIFCTYL